MNALEPSEDVSIGLNLRVPAAPNLSGKFVIAVLDFFNDVPEVNEANNVVVSPPIGGS